MEHLWDYPITVRRGPRTKADGSGLRQTGQPKQTTPTARAAMLTGIVKQSGIPSIIVSLWPVQLVLASRKCRWEWYDGTLCARAAAKQNDTRGPVRALNRRPGSSTRRLAREASERNKKGRALRAPRENRDSCSELINSGCADAAGTPDRRGPAGSTCPAPEPDSPRTCRPSQRWFASTNPGCRCPGTRNVRTQPGYPP